MSLDVYRTRSTTVEAIQYDGSNLEVFTGRSFQVLPNSRTLASVGSTTPLSGPATRCRR